MGKSKKVLVLGATGGIGGEVAATLLRHGWSVVAMARHPDAGKYRDGPLAEVEWVSGDAMTAADVRRAAEGADVIVHAVNPPAYRNWGKLVLPMINNTIEAAKAEGSRIVLPGTVYNFGRDAFPDLCEEAPQHAPTEKGRIRVELERRLEQAGREGARALIVRFGDFFGPIPGNNWFSQGLVTSGKRLRSITYPGARGVGHAWAYLPDAGETIARLLEREDELAPFDRFHFGGHWDADGTAMTKAIARAIGRPNVAVRRLPWPMLRIAGWFQETPREIWKMRYLWREAVRLDNRKLVAFLGEEPHTPLDRAVGTSLEALRVN